MSRKRTPSQVALGKAVREIRKKSGRSQEQAALDGGLDRSYITSVEGGWRNISIESLVKIARALDTKPSLLLARWEEIVRWKER